MSNQLLQDTLRELGTKRNIEVIIPSKTLDFFLIVRSRECTDNAIMIAWRGIQLFKSGRNLVYENQFESIRYDDRLDFFPFAF